MIFYLILIIMTLIGAFASLFLKKASSYEKVFDILKEKNLYIGGCLYLLSALLNIYILKFLPYSVVLPLTSLTYVWTLIISNKLLKERIGKKKILGISLILIGAILIAI